MSLKVNAALGFCTKAGKLKSGDFAVTQALKSKKARLVILDKSASEATKQNWQSACDFGSVRMLTIENAAKMTGKSSNIIFAIVDDNFAKMIIEAYDSSCEDNNIKDTDF